MIRIERQEPTEEERAAIEASTAIWARLNAIACEQQALSASATTNILFRDAGWRNAAYEKRSEALRNEAAELRAKLPKEGIASGQGLVMAKILGTVIRREDWEPEPPDDGYDASDPYERYEREVGIFRDE